jgi:uncharacterized protein
MRRNSRPLAAVALAIAFLVTGLVASPFASAQSTPVPTEEPVLRTISVEGQGSVKAQPDTANVSFGVLASNESLQEAQDEVSRRIDVLTQTMQDAGIAAEDISTNSYSVYPVPKYDRNGNYEGIERYEVTSGLSVIVRDIDSVGTILDQATEAGANQIWGISFYVDDPSAAASQARALAVEDARTKADELATASGMVVVNVVSITETYAPSPKAQDYGMGRGGAMAEDAEAASIPVPVSPGQTEISVGVQVVFEIEQAAG